MKIARIQITHFKRFTDLQITDIPETAKLVVLAGPNGCGKSSLFDAFLFHYNTEVGFGIDMQESYYAKPGRRSAQMLDRVKIEVFPGSTLKRRGAFTFRSAYRKRSGVSPPVTRARGTDS